jgi:hypothetical protein
MASPSALPLRERFIGLPPTRINIPILVLLGYIALLVSGFSTGLGVLQPLPIYVYVSLLLLVLQIAISENRSLARIVYIFVTSGFAIVYAGEVVFGPATGNFTRSPYTYIILNTLLLFVFVYDSIDRRRMRPLGLDARLATTGSTGGADAPGMSARVRTSPLSYGAFATDFVGLAILFYIAAFLIDLLGDEHFLGLFGIHIGPPYVIVDLHASLGLTLPANFNRLESLDLIVAFGATAASLLLLGLVGVAANTGQGKTPSSATSDATPSATLGDSTDDGSGGSAARSFIGSLWGVISVALNEVLLSLRLVLGPLVWLIPAFCIAAFSQQVVRYTNLSARAPGAGILDLFNPLNATARANVGPGLLTLLLGLVAVGAVVLAVIIVEHDGRIIWRTFDILRATGRTLTLTLAFFLYSLAALNAFFVLAFNTTSEPFQVGAPGLLALLAAAGFFTYAAGFFTYAAMTNRRAAAAKAKANVTAKT